MQFSPTLLSPKALLQWSAAFCLSLLSTLGVCHAQSGSFIIPSIRAEGGTDFAYWDLFARPPGSPSNINYNFANPPALIGGEDDDGNPNTIPETRTSLKQTRAEDCFITSSGAIYSFSEITEFEVPYQADENRPGEVTNVIFQTQTGGSRLNVNSVQLVYQQAGQPVAVMPVFRGMDDPQSGAFSERIVCAFQWDLTGLNVRNFKIVFASPTASMPLWQAQLDVVAGAPFEQELGYLLATRSRPLTRFGRAGSVDKNLPITVDGRFFLEGEELNIVGDPETGWQMSGWSYNGTTQTGLVLPLVFPARDITVTALFAPQSYSIWRGAMFYHANTLLGTENDHLDDAISAPAVDHDGDGLTNAGEYAFGGDPYEADSVRTRPQLVLVNIAGTDYPAIRYRTSGLQPGEGDVTHEVRVSANGGPLKSNSQEPTTVTFLRQLQSDGSELVTERTVQPMSSFASIDMDVAWSVGGVAGTPLDPAPLEITQAPALAGGQIGTSYSASLAATGGMEPYSWTVTAGAPPSGLTLAPNGTLSGTPTAAGSFSFTAKVTDSVFQNVTRVFSVEVTPYEITTASSLGSLLAGTPVNRNLAVAGGTAPFVWTVTAGELPGHVTLNSQGTLAGTPTETGEFQFTVQVQDANQITASKTFTWSVFELQIATESLPTAVVTLPFNTTLLVTGGAAPHSWTLTTGTLPLGLSLSTAGVISGTPTKSGTSDFAVTVTDGDGNSTSKSFSLLVSNTVPAPVVDPIVFTATLAGTEFTHTVTAANYPKQFVISGLPKGLKYVPATGTISGRTSTPGVFIVQVRASNAGGSSTARSASLVVKALPANQVGTFTGLISRDVTANGNLGSLFTLTTTTTGAYTLQVKTGSASKSAKGFLNGSAPHLQVSIGSSQLSLTLDPATKLVSGSHGSASVNGWRQVWDSKINPASSREGYYSVAIDLADEADASNVAIPHGVGYATFSVIPAGTLKITGKASDGQAIVASTALGPNGEVAVYVPAYANKGTLLGRWVVAEDEAGEFISNDVSGALTWLKPVTTGRTYAAAFGPVNLAVSGGYLASAAKGQIVLGLPDEGPFSLLFEGGGVEASAINPDVTAVAWTDSYVAQVPVSGNAGKVTLKVDKATGAVSGTFGLAETAPVLLRKGVKFQGQIVRLADGGIKAAGYFLLPQIPTGNEKATTSPILSGSLFIAQPTQAP